MSFLGKGFVELFYEALFRKEFLHWSHVILHFLLLFHLKKTMIINVLIS